MFLQAACRSASSGFFSDEGSRLESRMPDMFRKEMDIPKWRWSNIGFLGAIFWDKAISAFYPGTRNISQKKCILPTSRWTTAFNHTVGGSCRRKKSMFSTHGAPDVLSGRDAEIVVANMALPTTFGAATWATTKTPYSSVTMWFPYHGVCGWIFYKCLVPWACIIMSIYTRRSNRNYVLHVWYIYLHLVDF